MAPVSVDAVARCRKQTSDLFDIFLKLDSNQEYNLPKQTSVESKEVSSTIERDSARSQLVKSSNDSSILSRSPGVDVRRYHDEYQITEKRRSLDLAKRYSYGSTPPSSYLQERKLVNDRTATTTPPPPGASLEFGEVRCDERSHQNYQEFPAPRSRTYSIGPTEEQIREAALTIANVGDKIEEEYGNKLKMVEKDLCEFVRKTGANLTYEVFAAHINDLVEQDRNWRNFMFVMHLSRRVIKGAQTVGLATTEYFRQFIGDAFAEEIAAHNDVVQYIRSSDST